jgi:serine/threonine protein kinase
MGEVYEAEDLELRGRIALKTIHASAADESGAVERFKREIQLARAVTHPNVCRIFDFGLHELTSGAEPVVFLTMELLEARPRRAPGSSGQGPDERGSRRCLARRAGGSAGRRARCRRGAP